MCIVGGGFTGLWTALRIKEYAPEAQVVIVEADICGGGPSGRNGGFAMVSLWHQFIALEFACGSVEALRLAHASCVAIAEIGSFCEQHGIDAQYCPRWLVLDRDQRVAMRRLVEHRGGDRPPRHEHPFVALDPSELVHRTGCSVHIGGVFEPTCASLQPALLARGLMRVARERGVTVFEGSPMVALQRSAPLVVQTARGQIIADKVVLATGAWAAQVRELRRAFAVVSSDIAITRSARPRGAPGQRLARRIVHL